MKSALPLFVGVSIAVHGAGMLAPWNSDAEHQHSSVLTIRLTPAEPGSDVSTNQNEVKAAAAPQPHTPPPTLIDSDITSSIAKSSPAPSIKDTARQMTPLEEMHKLPVIPEPVTREEHLQAAEWTMAFKHNRPVQTAKSDASAAVQPSTEIAKTAPTFSIEEMRQHLHVSLRDALSRYFYYPRLAQRHGWQGEVMLALRVEADGHLTGVRVAESSGYAILDEAAAATLEKISRLEQAAAWLQGSHFDMVLPVRYRLVDG